MHGSLQLAAGQLGGEGIKLVSIAADNGDMRAEPCEQPADRPADAAGTSRHQDDFLLQRIGCEHGRMDRKLGVGQAGFFGIIHRLAPASCHTELWPYIRLPIHPKQSA